jgi:hypothetical protein
MQFNSLEHVSLFTSICCSCLEEIGDVLHLKQHILFQTEVMKWSPLY